MLKQIFKQNIRSYILENQEMSSPDLGAAVPTSLLFRV
jgi:hypothetical protein